MQRVLQPDVDFRADWNLGTILGRRRIGGRSLGARGYHAFGHGCSWWRGYGRCARLVASCACPEILDSIAYVGVLAARQRLLFAQLDLQIHDLVAEIVQLDLKGRGAARIPAAQLRQIPFGEIDVVLQSQNVGVRDAACLRSDVRRQAHREQRRQHAAVNASHVSVPLVPSFSSATA
jgi:hypothetical protein